VVFYNQFIAFHAARHDTTLIMPPRGAKGKQAETPAETRTIWFLLVDHEGKPRFGDLTRIAVQADAIVDDLKTRLKEENSTELGTFRIKDFEVWTYKHNDLSSDPTSKELEKIVGPIKYLKTGKNPKLLSSRQKVAKIDPADDVILLVRVPPLQTTDTAGGGDGESFIRLAPTQYV
jgi:hypothetical protein